MHVGVVGNARRFLLKKGTICFPPRMDVEVVLREWPPNFATRMDVEWLLLVSSKLVVEVFPREWTSSGCRWFLLKWLSKFSHENGRRVVVRSFLSEFLRIFASSFRARGGFVLRI